MQQYLDVLKQVIDEGTVKPDVQGPGNLYLPGAQMKFKMSEGFPLLTVRSLKGSWRALRAELLWILAGETNISGLHGRGAHHWDQWATPKICNDMGFPEGELGPVYGHQMRNFGATELAPGVFDTDGFDQLAAIVRRIRTNPNRRRAMIDLWDPRQTEEEDVVVAPCHVEYHFSGDGQGGLDLHLFQRAADVPIGVPFNTAEAALFLLMMAQITGRKPGTLVHTLSDAHVYRDQVVHLEEMLKREPKPLPQVKLNPDVREIWDFGMDDFELIDYDPHPAVKGIPVAT